MHGAGDTPAGNQELQPTFVLAVAAFLFGLTALPLLLVSELALIDYPEHLAMFHIIENISSSPHLKEYYELEDGLFPYWGIRAMMAVLTPVFGSETALRIFAVMALLMPAAGACVLGWTLAGRLTLAPLVSLLFVYNGLLNWGFINFMLCSGMSLMCLAAWIAGEGKSPTLRYAGLCLALTGLIWLHPLAAVLLGAMASLWELAAWVQKPRGPGVAARFLHVLATGACLLPAVAILVLTTSFKSAGPAFIMGGVDSRVWIAAMPLWMDASWWNLALGVLCVAGLLGLVAFGYLRPVRGVSRTSVYLLIAAYAAPLMFLGVFLLNFRLPVFALLMFIAGCALTSRGREFAKPIAALFAVALAAKLIVSHNVLQAGSDRVTDFRNGIASIPIGSRVLMAIDRKSPNYPGGLAEISYHNLGSYLIVDRQAFIPDIFGSVGVGYTEAVKQQTVLLGTPPDADVVLGQTTEGTTDEVSTNNDTPLWRRFYDYIIVIDFGDAPTVAKYAKKVAKGSFFYVYKIID